MQPIEDIISGSLLRNCAIVLVYSVRDTQIPLLPLCRQHETAAAWARRAAAWPAAEPAPAPIPQSPCPTAPYTEAVESSDGDYAWDGRMFVEGVPVTAGQPASSPQLPPHSIPQLGAPDFAAVLDAAQSSRGTTGPLLDSAALRHLVLSRPARLEPLSAVSLGPDTHVERVS